jgi:hypothetical protein
MNFEWNVVNMDRQASNGFVTTVHYSVSAVDGDFTASTYGTVGYTEEGNFTPYDQLTKEQVIGWVKDSLGEETVQASLTAQIDAQKNPVQESGLPWVAEVTAE